MAPNSVKIIVLNSVNNLQTQFRSQALSGTLLNIVKSIPRNAHATVGPGDEAAFWPLQTYLLRRRFVLGGLLAGRAGWTRVISVTPQDRKWTAGPTQLKLVCLCISHVIRILSGSQFHFWPIKTLNLLVAASKLHKHRRHIALLSGPTVHSLYWR